MYSALVWTVNKPFFGRWVVRRIDAILRDETGLGMTAESLEISPLKGRVVLTNFSIGEDLLKGRKLDLSFSPLSLLSNQFTISRIDIEAPESVLNQARLRQIRFKKRPPSATTPKVYVGTIAIRDGSLQIREPAWGLAQADFFYDVKGRGLGANTVAVTLNVPRLIVTDQEGSASIKARLSETLLDLQSGELDLDGNHIHLEGQYGFKARQISMEGRGDVDVQGLLDLIDPKQKRVARGHVEFSAQAKGPVDDLRWKLNVSGRGIAATNASLQPGTLQLEAHGSPKRANVARCTWDSQDGHLEATGEWAKGTGSRVSITNSQVSFAPLVPLTRVSSLQGLEVQLMGNVQVPGDPWDLPMLAQLTAKAEARFKHKGEDAGSAALSIDHGHLLVEHMDLRLPQVAIHGEGNATLEPQGFRNLVFQGSATTDAEDVANVLKTWKVVDLNMSGQTKVDARLSWTPAEGLSLDSQVDISNPRWEDAHAERLKANTSIRKDTLQVQDILLEEGEGRAYGDLWLTWADVAKDAPQIDMCYRAFRLPIEQGMKAAGLEPDLLKLLDAGGIGSGWVRIHGPYEHLTLEGHALAQQAHVLGLEVPCASAQFSMDINHLVMRLDDIRVAESMEALAIGEDDPTGQLALHGEMLADIPKGLWNLSVKGNVDSKVLGLEGPRIQGQVEAMLAGPWATPFGPYDLPEGQLRFSKGRVFLGSQSLEGFEGLVDIHDGEMKANVGMEGMTIPLLSCQAWRSGQQVRGFAELKLDPQTAETSHLATRMSGDLLKDGRLNLKLEGTWDSKDLIWQGTLNEFLAHFDVFDVQTRGEQKLFGNANSANVDLLLEGLAKPAGGTRSEGGTALLRLSGQIPFSKEGQLALQHQGSVELANLKGVLDQLLELNEYSLLADLKPQGVAKMDLKLGGTFADPSLNGTLSLVDGRLQIRTYPQSIDALDFTLRFQGRDIVLPESDPMRGQLAQGDLRAWGKATWGLGGLSNYLLHFSLDDFQLRDIPEGFEMTGSLENASLEGNDQDGGIIKGRIKATHTLYQADINLADLILTNALGNAAANSTLDADDPFARVSLDLDMEMVEPWQFDTNLLKLQGWPKDFKIRGTLAKPGFKGKMDFLPGGRVTNLLPAGDIVIEQGSMDFTDPSVVNPVLALRGRIDISPFVVNLNINGTMDQLNFVPTSTPSLRQDEIVAILVDPSMAQSIGTTSGSSSQSAMASGLASTGSGLLTTLAFANIQERLRKAFNLDRVNVALRKGFAGTSETNITFGKTINLFGHPTPLVFNHKKAGDLSTLSGQCEWRLGNFVLQFGASQTDNAGIGVAGEIRHTWILK